MEFTKHMAHKAAHQRQRSMGQALSDWLHFSYQLFQNLGKAQEQVKLLVSKEVIEKGERFCIYKQIHHRDFLDYPIEHKDFLDGLKTLFFYKKRQSTQTNSDWVAKTLNYCLTQFHLSIDDLVFISGLSKDKVFEIYFNFYQDQFLDCKSHQGQQSQELSFNSMIVLEEFMSYARQKYLSHFKKISSEKTDGQYDFVHHFNPVTTRDIRLIQSYFQQRLTEQASSH